MYEYYELYICPERPTDDGKYYGKTPLLNQALEVVKKAKKNGTSLYIRGVKSNGEKVLLL